MTEFIRSYGPAMRSNIAWTCPSSRVPLRAAALKLCGGYSPLSCERKATSASFFSAGRLR
jgi:hypothetical protein